MFSSKKSNEGSLRATALAFALQGQQPNETPGSIVARAEAFLAFLMKPEPLRS